MSYIRSIKGQNDQSFILRTVILIYYILVLVVFMALLIVVALGFVYKTRITNALRAELVASAVQYDPERPDHAITNAWDRLQSERQCCGVQAETSRNYQQPWLVWQTNTKVNSGSAESRYLSMASV